MIQKLKIFLKPFLFKNNGSVSIFAICIILPIFIINAVLIDMIRVMSAERQMDNAIEAALRSTMSNYNSQLAEYGIFVADNEAVGNFESMLNKQLFTPEELSGYSNLSQVQITNANANYNSSMNILEPDVFKHQINETMKYQAPIQMSGVMVDLFKQSKDKVDPSQAEDMKEMQDFLDKYEEVMELVKKRNAELKKVNSYVNNFKRDTTQVYNDDIIGVATESEKIPENIKSNMADLSKHFPKYVELIKQQEEEEEEEEEEDLSEEEQEEKEKAQEKVQDQIDYFEDARDKFNSPTGSVYQESSILASYELNKDEITKALYGNGDVASPSSNSAMDYNNQIKDLIKGDSEFKDIDKIILDDEFFTNIEQGFTDLDTLYLGTAEPPSTIGAVTNTKKYGLFVQASIFKLSMETKFTQVPGFIFNTSSSLIKDADKKIKSLTDEWKKYKNSEELLQKDDRYEETFDEAEEEADNSFAELFDLINTASEIGETYSADQGVYDTLQSYNSKYMGSGADGQFLAEEDRKAFIDQAFGKMQSMFELMTNPKAIRSELYMNEYVMANFGVKGPYDLKQQSFGYDTKQAMYIIYGHHQSGLNYGQFLLEVASIILAFTLFDALVKNPLSKLGWIGVMVAIGLAIVETVNLFKDFLNKESGAEVSIFGKSKNGKGGSFFITPSIMTRLFLSVRSLDESFNANKRIRIQAALSEASGVDFTTNGATYLSSNVEGKVKLLFLPTFFPGKVEGNQYILESEKHYNY